LSLTPAELLIGNCHMPERQKKYGWKQVGVRWQVCFRIKQKQGLRYECHLPPDIIDFSTDYDF
jgi:hypothetical protein